MFWLLVFLLGVRVGTAQDSGHANLDSDLAPWPRLKRQAGYFTESYQYRGGLYKNARDEENYVSKCENSTTTHCIRWKTNAAEGKAIDREMCLCAEGEFPFCKSWACAHQEVVPNGARSDSGCVDKVHEGIRRCSCHTDAENGRYCRLWKCLEQGSDGSVKNEEYACLREDASEEYCSRWKGEISSSYKVESVVCQCDERKEDFCNHWQCKQRGLIRCDAHSYGWCDLNIAIGVGGGLGIVFILLGGWFYVTAKAGMRVYSLVMCAAMGCIPLAVGVVIWGGERAIPWVASMWILAAILAALIIFATKRLPVETVTAKYQTKTASKV